MSNVLELTEENFNTEIKQHKGVCMVDFFATWCGPCKMMSPIIDEMAKELSGQVKIAKLDVQKAPGVAADFGVMGVPTFIVFKDGQKVDEHVGGTSKDVLKNKIMAHVK